MEEPIESTHRPSLSDDDEEDKTVKGAKLKKKQSEVKKLTSELHSLLNSEIIPKGMSRKYITNDSSRPMLAKSKSTAQQDVKRKPKVNAENL